MSFVFEVKGKLKDWNAKLDDVLQRMLTIYWSKKRIKRHPKTVKTCK